MLSMMILVGSTNTVPYYYFNSTYNLIILLLCVSKDEYLLYSRNYSTSVFFFYIVSINFSYLFLLIRTYVLSIHFLLGIH